MKTRKGLRHLAGLSEVSLVYGRALIGLVVFMTRYTELLAPAKGHYAVIDV
jgi:hypothetical protein